MQFEDASRRPSLNHDQARKLVKKLGAVTAPDGRRLWVEARETRETRIPVCRRGRWSWEAGSSMVIVFCGGSSEHSLCAEASSAGRVLAHWRGYCEEYGVPQSALPNEIEVEDPTMTEDKGAALKSCSSPSGWRTKVFDLVDANHRHHEAPTTWRFGLRAWSATWVVGAVVVETPKSRVYAKKHPRAVEVTRMCTFGPEHMRRNAVSKLYAAASRRAQELGADRIITYTMEHEDGASLRASGFIPVALTEAREDGWSRPGRERETPEHLCGRKVRWEKGLTKEMKTLIESRAIVLG